MNIKILVSANDSIKITLGRLSTDVSNVVIEYIGLWNFISENTDLTREIVVKFADKIIWYIVLKKWMKDNLVDDILFESEICDKHIMLIKMAEKDIFNNNNCKDLISDNKAWFYSIKFINCFSNDVDWKWITKNIDLPMWIIDRYFDSKIDHTEVYKCQNLADTTFLKYHEKEINWKKISEYQKYLTEVHFIVFNKNLYWNYIFSRYPLSMRLLNSLPEHVIYNNINDIAKTQNLDEDFIIKYINILNPSRLKHNERLSNKIKEQIYLNIHADHYIFLIPHKKEYREFN